MTGETVLLLLASLMLTNPPVICITDYTEVKVQTAFGSTTNVASTHTPTDEVLIHNLGISEVVPSSVTTKGFFEESAEEDGPSILTTHEGISLKEIQITVEPTTSTAVEEHINETTLGSLQMRTVPPQHPCVVDVDESEPEFQRYVCTGNWVISLIATTFLLTMIFFAVISTSSDIKHVFTKVDFLPNLSAILLLQLKPNGLFLFHINHCVLAVIHGRGCLKSGYFTLSVE